MTETIDHLQIERDLDASPQRVWQMWVDPEHFAAWYGPAGATVPVAKLDARVGGQRLVCVEMTTPEGPRQMWFAGEFLAVDPPHRLVYTEAFADANGTIARPSGMPDSHPVTTEVRVELEDLGGRTRLRLTHVGVPADSPGATGWSMALDKLARRLVAR